MATDQLFDPACIEDPYGYFAELRESEPVHRVAGTDAFLVTRMDLIHQVVADTSTFSSNSTDFLHLDADGSAKLLDVYGNVDSGGIDLSALATADPPDHGRQRKVLTPLFSNAAMAKRESEFRQLVDARLDPFLATGRIEWMADVAEPLPLVMLARLLGVDEAHAPTLKTHGYAAGELIGGFASPEHRPALLGEMGQVDPIFGAYAAALAEPEPDTTTVIGTCAKAVGDGSLTESEVMVILGTLVAAGGESTTSLLGTAVRLLAQQPDLQQRLRSEPDLIPTFVEEALRIDPPFRNHYRRATTDTVLAGTTIPSGAKVILVWSSANRDPSAFDQPESIDVRRPNPRQHVGFGWGIHLCIGAPLARLEARVTLEQLLARTTGIALADGDRSLAHHRSLMIRRLVELPLAVTPVP